MPIPTSRPSRSTRSSRRARRTSVALVGAVLALGLSACSGSTGSSDSSTSSGSAASSGAQGTSETVSASRAVADTAGGARSATDLRPASVIKTGHLSLTSTDIAAVRTRIDRLVAAAGGSLDTERSTNARDGSVRRSTLVLRVPVARFAAVKDDLERLGTVKSSTESAKDVTTQVIDVRERVRTLRTSLDRLHRFQRRATDARDLIRFEEDLTTRQAELQSLESQQSYLADQTALSTLTVRLSVPAAHVTPAGALDDAGFLPGLRHGWHALVGAGVVVLTALGAGLPWLVVIAVVGWPALLVLRRRSRRTAPTG